MKPKWGGFKDAANYSFNPTSPRGGLGYRQRLEGPPGALPLQGGLKDSKEIVTGDCKKGGLMF